MATRDERTVGPELPFPVDTLVVHPEVETARRLSVTMTEGLGVKALNVTGQALNIAYGSKRPWQQEPHVLGHDFGRR